MAYTREEKENLEVSFSVEAIWEAIPKVTAKLEWTIQETSEEKHYVKIKTKGAFFSYPSKFEVTLTMVDEKTTKMSIAAETPVTTITSVADYGRTRERVDAFVTTLAKMMGS